MNTISQKTENEQTIYTYKGIDFYEENGSFKFTGAPVVNVAPHHSYIEKIYLWRDVIDWIDTTIPDKPAESNGIMNTFTGIEVNIFDPKPEMICIEDIVHSLAKTCRFAAHTGPHYSVAEHCLIGLNFITKPKNKLAWLMHDSPETFLGDVISPLKKVMLDYLKIEHNFSFVIAEKFGFQYPFDEEIERIDKMMGQLELEHFMWKTKDHSHLFSALPWEQAKKNYFQTLLGYTQIK